MSDDPGRRPVGSIGNHPRLLMIGLDAAEPRLIEEWAADGSLTNLARLRSRGAYGRLDSTADWLVGSPWPSFYTGKTPADHGCYHYLGWRPELMSVARLTPDYLPLTPFWRELSEAGPRVVAIDVPLTYAPEPFNGVEISGWGTHETIMPTAAHPPSLMPWVSENFGPPARSDEIYERLPLNRLLEIRDEQNRTTDRVMTLALALMEREKWDLFLVCFSATHRGGHKLWDDTGTTGSSGTESRERLRAALRSVYEGVDFAVGRLVEMAGEGVTTLVFSVHGMGPNTCRTDVLGQMLDRVLAENQGREADPRPGSRRILDRVRELVPTRWRHAVKRRLPLSLQDRLTVFWRLKGIDWNAARAVSLVADLQGYIRINLRGREASGIVEPGIEYDALCAQIAEGLRTFTDADTEEPVVREIVRISELYSDGARRHLLPDLVVKWSPTPSAAHREIISARYGSVPWPTPGRNPTGRSGNHRPQGFLLAVGERFPPRSRIEGAHILDIAPTVYNLIGFPAPPGIRGRVLTSSLRRSIDDPFPAL